VGVVVVIRIYDKEEQNFTSLGLGSLDETLAAVVVEKLNGSYEMEMDYPITGRHFDKIQHRNIIFCKPNPHTNEQPFRIYNITKPLEGTVIISAEHISYDASGVVILPKRNSETKVIESFGDRETVGEELGYQLDTILRDINGSAVASKNQFTLSRYVDTVDIDLPLGENKANDLKEDGYSILKPMNLRSMLGGSEESITDLFKGEYLFDKFRIKLYEKRGINRGITVRYGKNMTDLEQETSGENLFTAIFPFYSKSYTESYTSTTPIFQPTYIVSGKTPLRADWLSVDIVGDKSLGIGGIPFPPVVELFNVVVSGANEMVAKLVAIRVKTPNSLTPVTDFYDKIYVFRKNTADLDNLVDAYIIENQTAFDSAWLSLTSGGAPLSPEFGNIYVVKTDNSEYANSKFIFDGGVYVEYDGDGFYCEAKEVDSLNDAQKDALVAQYGSVLLPRYKISYNESLAEKWYEDPNGSIYVRPYFPNVGTVSVDKYEYFDLLTPEPYVIPDPPSESILENGVLYVNGELKELQMQRIYSLDLTESLDDGNIKPTDVTQKMIFDKAEQYLKDNDFTKITESLTISFIKLSDSPEYAQFKQLEIVELGDEISVIYEELGVNSKRRVISTEYDVLAGSYNEIELGDEIGKITNNIVSVGDNISSLKNDGNFANKQYITELIAENAQIVNAEIQNAIIKTLQATNINVSGIFEASLGIIDKLIASTFTTDYAEVAKALVAGSVRVRGDITLDSGSITINKKEDSSIPIEAYIIANKPSMSKDWLSLSQDATPLDPSNTVLYPIGTIFKINTVGYYLDKKYIWNSSLSTYVLVSAYVFSVDRDGNVVANNLLITGGSIKIGDNFYVTNDGYLVARNVEVIDGSISIKDKFEVDDGGLVTAKALDVDDAYIKNIDANEVKATDVIVDKIYLLEDKSVSIERIMDDNMVTEVQTVVASALATGVQDGDILRIRADINILNDVLLWYEKTFVVSVKYYDNYGMLYTQDVNVTVSEDGSTSYSEILIGIDDAYVYSVGVARPFPSTYEESRLVGGTLNKVVIKANNTTYDIITGIINNTDIIRFFAQVDQPDTTNLENNSLWFDID